ncbi:uncharacterized protein LOC123315765 isoform X1 [Coccinella septempunctata]|uniref:uncharacterized protein LOC123315765 isoform X1 n=1 Tax=Coccinella septempunctata TaxID=41139 RepID=UPI001D0853C9|nr:uncharacterized protein LOC123315765 isoform X1 [Coccinella septempunctata]
MNRQINVQNEQNEDESEETLLDQCESCCHELQHAATYPYQCVYNDVLQEYKIRLKRARMELADKELMIALLKEQHSKMDNYCRCSLEEARNIKAKYFQLAQDMENMKKEYLIQMHRPSNASNESAEAYLRSEIDAWKKENKEILGKIEMVDFDVQKLLQIVSDTAGGGQGGELEARMARLEEVIEKQSGILALLHSKVAEHSKAMIFSDILVGSKLDEIMERTDKSREDLKDLDALKSKETSKNATTNTEDPRQHFMDEVTSTTNTELILGDFLEIAAREKKFFEDHGAISISEVYPPPSEQLSGISEMTTGEKNKLFREMPVNPIVPPKRHQNPLEGFNEFQHFESARFSGGLSPFTPGVVEENDEKSLETPVIGSTPTSKSGYSLPACCVIPQEESEKSMLTNDFPVVLFKNVDKKKVPLCCRASGDLGEDLRIEEVSSSTQPDYSGTLPVDIMAGDQKVTTPELSLREQFLPLVLDETSSLAMKAGEGQSETSKDDPLQNVKIPKCCKVPKETKEDASIEEYEHPIDEEEIPIIYEIEIPPTPVYEEEIPRKFVSLLSLSTQNNEDDGVNFLLSLSDHLRETVKQLDQTLEAAQRETTTLHSLKEDFVRIIDQELNKNLPEIKANIDLVNNTLNVIQNDVKIIKIDLKNVLKQQKKQSEELKKSNETKELRAEKKKTDPNKVLVRVKSLEKRLCECGKDVFKEKNKTVCKPATGCKCKYTNKQTNNKDDDNTKDRKICLTVQTCLLNADNSMIVPFFTRFGNENNDFGYIPRLTYKIKKEHDEESEKY